jgi:hypothetical protein
VTASVGLKKYFWAVFVVTKLGNQILALEHYGLEVGAEFRRLKFGRSDYNWLDRCGLLYLLWADGITQVVFNDGSLVVLMDQLESGLLQAVNNLALTILTLSKNEWGGTSAIGLGNEILEVV